MTMRGKYVVLSGLVLMGGCATTGEWLDQISKSGTVGELTQQEIVAGLRAALDKGVDHAVAELGHDGGFFRNVELRIPVPEALQAVERGLRAVGQGPLVDEFQLAINRAAEKAVPEAASILVSSIRQLTLRDAEQILRGHDTAATDFFRRTSHTNLYERFLPIVQDATARAGVTAAYKRMTANPLAAVAAQAVLGRETVDLDAYVTTRALDGLFLKIAEQEKLIRENPAERTTEILRRVFGAVIAGQPPRTG